jgi:hypothetical protein
LANRIKIEEKKAVNFENKVLSLQRDKAHLVDKISVYDNKVKDIKRYPCLQNENCCLLKDLKSNEEKSAALKIQLTEINEKIKIETLKKEENKKVNVMSEDEKTYNKMLSLQREEMNNFFDLGNRIGIVGNQIEHLEQDKQNYYNLFEKYEVYENYLSFVGKDGISKQIIAKNLKIINSQIKKILSTNVSFDIYLQSDEDGKAVEIFFKHSRQKPRRIELCSRC